MDGTAAIEANRIALKRIVAMLVEMAGLGEEAGREADELAYVSDSPLTASLRSAPLPLKGGEERRPSSPPPLPTSFEGGAASRPPLPLPFEQNEEERAASPPPLPLPVERGAASPPRSPLPRRSGERWPAKRVGEGVDLTRGAPHPEARPDPDARAQGTPPTTLPRLLWRAILALLRPAESATRRLIIATARGLTVPPPPARKAPKPQPIEPLLRQLSIAVMIAPASAGRDGVSSPAQRGRGTAEGGGGGVHLRIPAFPLFDPPRRLALHGQRHHTIPPHAAPRIVVPGLTEPHRLPLPPSPDDPISATRLTQRLAALVAALDDLPGHARRFARWKARRNARRLSPIRRVPPGGRLTRYDPAASHPRNIREIDEILAHAHSLALHALESPDTS